MHKTSSRLGVVLLLLAGALAGCSKSNSPSSSITDPTGGSSSGASLEQSNVTSAMSGTPELIEDGIAESADQTDLSGADAMGATIDATRPIIFFRKINSVNRRFEFAFSDTDSTGRPTSVAVGIFKTLKGTFNILERTVPDSTPPDTTPPPSSGSIGMRPHPGLPDSTLHLVSKPLEDHWERHLLLKRVHINGRDSKGFTFWRVAATSGVKVTSAGATTQIMSLRIQSGDLDTTITDPLALFRLRRVLRLTAGSMVTLTATTGRNDDVVVLNYWQLRRKFHNNGDNTYTAQVRAGWLGGCNHFGVNALSHGTLFDDAAAYDSQAWILPYVVEPTELAEFMP
ncbi:MAG TPA: hypothetical protein VMJ70_12785 [Candidatus Sulfotelmatobacter sp.]|nr:hypothetical protein [Candidatus Sulfotelmatobacter sp.]